MTTYLLGFLSFSIMQTRYWTLKKCKLDGQVSWCCQMPTDTTNMIELFRPASCGHIVGIRQDSLWNSLFCVHQPTFMETNKLTQGSGGPTRKRNKTSFLAIIIISIYPEREKEKWSNHLHDSLSQLQGPLFYLLSWSSFYLASAFRFLAQHQNNPSCIQMLPVDLPTSNFTNIKIYFLNIQWAPFFSAWIWDACINNIT